MVYQNDNLDEMILDAIETADAREYPYEGCSMCSDWDACSGAKASECAFDADPAFDGVEEPPELFHFTFIDGIVKVANKDVVLDVIWPTLYEGPEAGCPFTLDYNNPDHTYNVWEDGLLKC